MKDSIPFKKTICIVVLLFTVLIFASYFLLEFPGSYKPAEPQINSPTLIKNTVEEGTVKRTEYLDAEGHLTYASDKHYAVLVTTFCENRRLDEYFDENGNPAKQTSGHYALLREYDEEEKLIRQTYLGADGQPMINTSGYAILYRTYYEQGPFEGKAKDDYYFDTEGNPVARSLGHYGFRREYDEQGRNYLVIYLNAEGQPVSTNLGYSMTKKTYYEDNKTRTIMYYDLSGNQIALANGQYGTLQENGKTYPVDKQGNKMFVLSSFLMTNPFIVYLGGLALVLIAMLSNRKVNVALLAVYLVFIFYMTLMYRESGAAEARLELFWSYRQFLDSRSMRLEVLNNIWLFIPLGAILCRLWPRARMLVLPIILSVGIEVVQYVTGFGLAELDDVISNTLGALIGWGIVKFIRKE